MAMKLYSDTDIQAIANAIRTKNGLSTTYKVSEMAAAIQNIPSASVETKTLTNSSATNTSISFTSMKGIPKWFFLRCTAQLSRSSNNSYYYVTDMRYNGTNTTGNYWRMSTGNFYNDTSHYSFSYSGTTLTISSSGARNSAGGSFYNGQYELVYIY